MDQAFFMLRYSSALYLLRARNDDLAMLFYISSKISSRTKALRRQTDLGRKKKKTLWQEAEFCHVEHLMIDEPSASRRIPIDKMQRIINE